MTGKILITGANGQLGVEVVKAFLHAGYHVLAADRSNEHLNVDVHSGSLEFFQIDLTNDTEAENLGKQLLEKHSPITHALFLAGGFAAGGLDEADAESIRKMIELNFFSAYNLARPLYREMIRVGAGKVILVGAKPAIEPRFGSGLIAYTLSKSLLFSLAGLLNEMGKGEELSATVIVPGTIDTKTNRDSMPEADVSKWVKPSAIAEILLFVCSGKADPLRENILKLYGNG